MFTLASKKIKNEKLNQSRRTNNAGNMEVG